MLKTAAKYYYTLRQLYYKLRKKNLLNTMTKIITNHSTAYDKLRQKVITNYGKKVLQITSKIYYKLRQLKFLQIIDNYYKLQQFSMLLQTTSKTITT